MEDSDAPADPRDVGYTHIMYALHAVAVAIGLFTTAFIALKFLFSAPSIVAVIMNYARRGRVHGTWLATHFRWQLRTFWWAMLWVFLLWFALWPLALVLIGLPLMLLGLFVVGVWVAYRVARGWMALRDGRTMPVPT
ncbi:MAG TPA: hypothetical protein VMH77_08025 [Steroidobacteraceae bacterium]|nr:hypothetical protein [Steroidobacteraceae bacterium]